MAVSVYYVITVDNRPHCQQLSLSTTAITVNCGLPSLFTTTVNVDDVVSAKDMERSSLLMTAAAITVDDRPW